MVMKEDYMLHQEVENSSAKNDQVQRIITPEEKRQVALERAAELKLRIEDYLVARDHIETGFDQWPRIEKRKARILQVLNGTEADWNDWKWHMKNRIRDVEVLAQIIDLTDKEIEDIKKVGQKFRWAISPYYASLMSERDPSCPVRLQAIPSILELLDQSGKDDPMGEEFTSPAPCITRRYPDRLIINVTNQCAMYCRHCQRRRNIGEVDRNKPRSEIKAAIEYIRANPEIRDVLITGGDALLLSNSELDWILTQLDSIPHVEIKRIGTRTLVSMPQRITPQLCEILEKHPPLYINTQFNHPKEITPAVAEACDKLIKAGAVLGNQAVLLNGINNNVHVMKKLNHELLKVRIRPYYIFHAKTVTGTSHFITKVEEGIKIMEKLRGYTSGLAVPTYIINAPKGYGKTPMLPEYLISSGEDEIVIRTWEKKVISYPNKKHFKTDLNLVKST
ncbi:glutamate 2,3-aminomutase [Thermincola potens]|uniref:Lysine 2,3-aminomutase YodO family protein n=1 Tax=Thermincola potens (strain JR) TaxID=635013 RepID=D5X7U1_THEPJ|nr:glutamate 2,3-aminomutase [Thermincola potens]ADG82661.1 lysine 2,3-aminomutase YodO family protein [Thermincola potens JR]